MEMLLFGLLWLVGTIVALKIALDARRELDEMTKRVGRLESLVFQLERLVCRTTPRVDSPTQVEPEPEPQVPEFTWAFPRPENVTTTPVAEPAHVTGGVVAKTSVPAPGPTRVPPPLPPTQLRPEPKVVPPTPKPALRPSGMDWEQFLGARLLSWVGGVVLFLAVAFFVKLSFERGWISPAMRAGLGAVLGAGLVGAGVWLRDGKSRTTGLTLVGTGLLILYGITYSCHSVYHFGAFSLPVTFLCMVLLTASALGLALRLDAMPVAVLGMAAGFLTPVVLSTGQNSPGILFSYVALLDLGLIGVAWKRRWEVLSLLAALGTLLMQYGWYMKFATPEQFPTIEWVFLGFPAAFVAVACVAWSKGWKSLQLAGAAAALGFGALGICFTLVVRSAMARQTGHLFLMLAGADVVVLILAGMVPMLRRLEAVASGAVFMVLGIWMTLHLTPETMAWALGVITGFGVLHAIGWMVQSRRGTEWSMGLESQLFPAMVLLLLFVPLVREFALPWGFWPVAMVLDLLAVAAALVSGSILGIGLVLFLSLGVAGVWVEKGTGSLLDLSESLMVVGGYAVFFFGIGCLLARKLEGRVGGDFERFTARIPSLAALLPLVLLNMVIAKIRPLSPVPVYSVALGLSLLALGWSWWKRQGSVALLALAGVFVTQATWLVFCGETIFEWGRVLGWNLGFLALFFAFPFLDRMRWSKSRAAWISSALAGPLQFLLVYWLFRKIWPEATVMGLLPLMFAVPYLMAAWGLWRIVPKEWALRMHHVAWFGAVSLFFLTVALPIQFDRQVLTVSLALEGVALIALFRRLPHAGLLTVGVSLLVAAFTRLTLNPAVVTYPRSGAAILNWYLYTYGTVTVALFAGAYGLKLPGQRVWKLPARPVLFTLGTVLAFVLVNLEIADAFATGPGLSFQFSGNLARGLSYTVAWSLFAFVLLVIGLRKQVPASRYAGLVLMGVTLAKLLIFDTAHLEQVYRIVAFAAVAVLSILASFLYQRFQRVAEPSRDGN